jgi:hypothetical protein
VADTHPVIYLPSSDIATDVQFRDASAATGVHVVPVFIDIYKYPFVTAAMCFPPSPDIAIDAQLRLISRAVHVVPASRDIQIAEELPFNAVDMIVPFADIARYELPLWGAVFVNEDAPPSIVIFIVPVLIVA